MENFRLSSTTLSDAFLFCISRCDKDNALQNQPSSFLANEFKARKEICAARILEAEEYFSINGVERHPAKC
ncbi:MAG: hypothetical protein J0G33_15165 [Afipia felis]|nr:hypothetical protein [Afipia felis]